MQTRLLPVRFRFDTFHRLATIVGLLAGLQIGSTASAADVVELTELTEENWAEFAPAGKEADAILGDIVLRNGTLTAVVGRPTPTRHANMTVRFVGGCLIDLTRRDRPNDQLSAYYPGGAARPLVRLDRLRVRAEDGEWRSWEPATTEGRPLRAARIGLEFAAESLEGRPDLVVRYTLGAGEPALRVETVYHNRSSEPATEELQDAIRADRVFEFGTDAKLNLFWAADDWFGQAYGVVTPGRRIVRDKLLKLTRDGSSTLTLAPGARETVERWIFPAATQMEARGVARRLGGEPSVPMRLEVVDPAGPVAHARVAWRRDGEEYGFGRTDAAGRIACDLPAGRWELSIEALGRPTKTATVDTAAGAEFTVRTEACGYVVGRIVDEQGGSTPCKVAFYSREQGFDPPRDKDGKFDLRRVVPYFGPDSGETAVHNLHYSHDGRFRQEIAPGVYDVVVSRGVEYDAVFTTIEVAAGRETELRAALVRSVDTRGWISADFHSHSSPSGDNVGSQRGRVQNLLAEQIEFAPCTEHNRIDSYQPHLEALDAARFLATCTGMELTGALLPVNHQNAFPLRHRPRTQDGGGPVVDLDPVAQIERLALWDEGAEKLVQSNHPNLVQIYGDRDLDGVPDEGFRKMFGRMDAMEVHPPASIFDGPPTETAGAKAGRNRMFYWLQLFNLGYRIPGVVNTDAHYNFHGSGWLRNYIRCSTDDPARIDPLEIVRATERGQVTMTNGPFLEVQAEAASSERTAIPGGDLQAKDGRVALKVRVQCPNWFDVNRVQVFVNGRPDPALNFTRRTHPEQFGDGVVKFDRRMETTLTHDAHLVVAVTGEGLQLGRVMGPEMGRASPTAVSNPIFVDRDGDGFQPNGDLLDAPLPGAPSPPKSQASPSQGSEPSTNGSSK